MEDKEDECPPPSKKDLAKDMLSKMLSGGKMAQPEIKEIFEKTGICKWRTVETAKCELGIEQFYGNNGISFWRLGK
jgi:hypothetical protein